MINHSNGWFRVSIYLCWKGCVDRVYAYHSCLCANVNRECIAAVHLSRSPVKSVPPLRKMLTADIHFQALQLS